MTKPFKEKLIAPNKYTRPQLKLLGVKGVIMHYTANNGGTALNHFNYFNTLRDRYAGAHIFIDRKEAYLIIPLNEVAYHANDGGTSKVKKFNAKSGSYQGNANLNTVGIELCLEADGSLHSDTVKRAETVVKWLLSEFKLTSEDVYRHYDITGKICPKMWVDNPKQFEDFKKALTPPKPVKKAPVVKAPVKVGSANILYTVKRGDTLSGMAVKYDTTVNKLKELNNLKSDLIIAGRKLIVGTKSTGSKKVLVKVKAHSLWYYGSANWDDKVGMANKGDVFTVDKEVLVKGSKMYKLISGRYITANTKYVEKI